MRKGISMLGAVVLAVQSTSAVASGMALAGKVGTAGLGLEFIGSLTQSINGRVGVNYFNYDYSGTESDIDYEFDLNLGSANALLDWHPFNGGFRLSTGFFYNQNEVDARGEPNGSFNIGNTDYPATEVGTLKGNIDFDDFAPYVGIGWGNAVGKNKRLSLVADLGVMFQGTPHASLSADGDLASVPAFQADLAREEQELQDAIDEFKYFPVVSVGVSYRFF